MYLWLIVKFWIYYYQSTSFIFVFFDYFVIPCFLSFIVFLMTKKWEESFFDSSYTWKETFLREIEDYFIRSMNNSIYISIYRRILWILSFAIDQIVLWERKEIGFSVNVILLTRSCSCLTGTRLNCKFMYVRVWHAWYLGYSMLLSLQLMRWRIYFILLSLSWTMCYSIKTMYFRIYVLWMKNVCSEISNWLS